MLQIKDSKVFKITIINILFVVLFLSFPNLDLYAVSSVEECGQVANQSSAVVGWLGGADGANNSAQNNKEFCMGAFIQNNDFLNTYSIYLYGNDDYSITTDFFTKKEAFKEWNKLKKLKTIKKDDLLNHYFSN